MNKDNDLFSFLVNIVTTIWHWRSTTLMGLKQAVSTGKPIAKYPYQRRAWSLKQEFSHPQRSNKIPGFLQNNPLVDFLSAKLKLIHSEVSWAEKSFVQLKSCCQQQILLSVPDLDLEATCSEAGDRGDDPESSRACSSLREDSMWGCIAAVLYLPSYGWELIRPGHPLAICLDDILQSTSVMLVNAGDWICSIMNNKNGTEPHLTIIWLTQWQWWLIIAEIQTPLVHYFTDPDEGVRNPEQHELPRDIL